MGSVQETGSLIPSLDGSNLSYEFEKDRIANPKEQDVSVVIKRVNLNKKIPDNLEGLTPKSENLIKTP